MPYALPTSGNNFTTAKHGGKADGYTPRLPVSNFTSNRITAITSNVCINPPLTLKANIPKSHPMMRITTIIYNKFPMKNFI
jgi:hypothetical protein